MASTNLALRLTATLLTLMAMASMGPAAALADNGQDGWALVSERNQIQVFMRRGEQAPLKTFRGVTRFRLDDEYAMVALLNDYDAYPDWLHFVDHARELGRKQETLRQVRLTTLLPWPLADREAVLESRVSQDTSSATDEVVVRLSNRPHLIPEDPDYVRFPHLQGELRFRRLPENQVEVVYQLEMDPGGYIPTWLVNILMRDAPYFTLERLRRVVHRAEYQGHYYDWLDLRGPGRPEALSIQDSQRDR